MVGWKPAPFIFVHIPKCAGTSVERALIPFVAQGKRMEDLSANELSRHWLHGKGELQHSKFAELESRLAPGPYFKFSFVRNPWDRTISHIEYLRHARYGRALVSGGDLKENIRAYCQATGYAGSHDLGCCQLDYLTNATGKMRMDFIGRFECLADDFEKVCLTLGIAHPPGLPHIYNSHRQRHYSHYFDEESAHWVLQRFIRDVEYFGYTLGRPHESPV